jgi:thiamine-monophosphate kinase
MRAGQILGQNRAASACIDLSDGLADAVQQIGRASGVGFLVDAESLPIQGEVRAWCAAHGIDPVQLALSGGDDYELLFTVRPRHRGRLRHVAGHVGNLPITRIGTVTREPRFVLRSQHGDRELPSGFEHFA